MSQTTPASAANERDLLPCPHCGGKARYLPLNKGLYPEKAICDACDIAMPPAAWNRHAILQPAAELDEQKLLALICDWEALQRGPMAQAKWDAMVAYVKGCGISARLTKAEAQAIRRLALDLEQTGRLSSLSEGNEKSDAIAKNREIQCALEDMLEGLTVVQPDTLTDAEAMRSIIKRYDEYMADSVAQALGTPFKAWAAAKYPAEYARNSAHFLPVTAPDRAPSADSAADGWISVETKLPEWAARDDTVCVVEGRLIPPTLTSETVLVALDGGGIRTDKLTAIEGGNPWFHTYGWRVTHWQPLPAAPAIAAMPKEAM